MWARSNEMISHGKMNELILIQEALQEKKMGDVAEKIASQPDKKFVMIAGPSSSGKTTFSHRLSIQLRAKGLIPHPIAVDNYFVNRWTARGMSMAIIIMRRWNAWI